MEDFIGIKRRINEHWIYKDSQCFHAWFEMLRSARYAKEPKTDIYEGIVYTINYAEFIFGRPSWSRRLNIGEEKLRILIKRLLSSDMIVLKQKHSKFTIYKIVNYEKYNQHDNHVPDIERSSTERNNNQQDNQQTTSRQPADNQQTTTKEEGCKKEEKVKKEIYITIQTLTMTKEEYDKLVDLYGKFTVDNKIEHAENYKGFNKKYVDLYKTLNNWLKKDAQDEKPRKEGMSAWGTKIVK